MRSIRQQLASRNPFQGARCYQSSRELLERPQGRYGKAAGRVLDVYRPAHAPGLHYYTVIVEGAEVSDPSSTAYFGGSKWASAVEAPEAGVTYYLPQDVPHGQVRQVWYHSLSSGRNPRYIHEH